jgi:predicted phosphodiesterase
MAIDDSLGLPPPAQAPLQVRKCDGLLFVGDPHLTCVRPGRRLEEDFLAVGEDKLMQARQIAQEGNLAMILLGDLFENPKDKKAGTTKVVEDRGRLIRSYARAMGLTPSAVDTLELSGLVKAITIPGNHDKDEVRLTSDCTLKILGDLGFVDIIEPSGPFAVFDIGGRRIGLGGTPYGEEIPRDIRGVFGIESVDQAIWLTHGLFAFDERPPGVPDPFEIVGCDIVVNGHDHTSQKPRQFGQTRWFNPGNITRMSVDCVDHIPSVWEWKPGYEELIRRPLRYNAAAFDLVGLQVAADADGAHRVEASRQQRQFSALLAAQQESEMARSDSGDLLKNEIEEVIGLLGLNERVATTIRGLHLRAIEKIKP